MRKTLCLSVFTLMLFGGTMSSGAATIRIPADYPAIQAGINAAVDGDTVLVDPGTYLECIDYLGKGITVASSAGPELTIIDAGTNCAAVTITGNQDQQKECALQGFTLRNGGPIVDVKTSCPAIRGNILEGNHELDGGISLDHAPAVIEKNQFYNINCGVDEYVYATTGVIFIIGSAPIIRDNLFLNNPCVAIHVFDRDLDESPQITNNTIIGNVGGI